MGLEGWKTGRVEDSFLRQIPWVNPLKQMKRSHVARYKSAGFANPAGAVG